MKKTPYKYSVILKTAILFLFITFLLCGCSHAKDFSSEIEEYFSAHTVSEGSKLICYFPEAEIKYSTKYLPEELAARFGQEIGGIVAVQGKNAQKTFTITDAADGEVYANATFDKSDSERIARWITSCWDDISYHRSVKAEIRNGTAFKGDFCDFLVKQVDSSGISTWDKNYRDILPSEYAAVSPNTAMGYIELTNLENTESSFFNTDTRNYPDKKVDVYLGNQLVVEQYLFPGDSLRDWLNSTLESVALDSKLTASFQNYIPSSVEEGSLNSGIIGYNEDLHIYSARFIDKTMLAVRPENANYLLSYSTSRGNDGSETISYTLKDFRSGYIMDSDTVSANSQYLKYDPVTNEKYPAFPPYNTSDILLFEDSCSEEWQDMAIRCILGRKKENHDASGSKLVAYILNEDRYSPWYIFDGPGNLFKGVFSETEFFAGYGLSNIGGYLIIDSSYPKSFSQKYVVKNQGNKIVDVTFPMESLTLTMVAADDGHSIATKNFTVTSVQPPNSFKGVFFDHGFAWEVNAADCFDVVGWIRDTWNDYLKTR